MLNCVQQEIEQRGYYLSRIPAKEADYASTESRTNTARLRPVHENVDTLASHLLTNKGQKLVVLALLTNTSSSKSEDVHKTVAAKKHNSPSGDALKPGEKSDETMVRCGLCKRWHHVLCADKPSRCQVQ